MNLRYIPYNQVDKKKWDDCLQQSPNALIYATSLFLDKMAGQWDAIVEGDYDAVMPLPFRKKFGVRYIFQPAFIQQGGIFSKYEITEAGTGLFLDLAFQHFRFAEFTLNYSNGVEENYKPKFRSNFIIPLDEDLNIGIITQDQKFYKELEIAEKFSLLYNHANDPNQAIGLYQKLYGSRLPFFERNDFKKFSSVCEALDPADVIIREARSNDDLHAQCLLIRYKQRLYNLVNNVTAAGRASSANYFLFNEIVKEFADQEFILDLEGSDVKGIAFFYKRLGSIPQPYPFIRHNNLPWPLRIFKQA